MMPKVMIIGARTNSLGYYIARALQEMRVLNVTAGISTEPVHIDCTDEGRMAAVFSQFDPTHVVCTIGTNNPAPFYVDWWCEEAQEIMDVNYLMPMRLLAAYADHLGGMPGTFVAISSNSAQIPRSNSAAYCASKAALSMGLRCAARDATRAELPLRVWGYEPGALDGTPMTKGVQRDLPAGVPMSRMLTNPGGLDTRQVARMVARDLLDAGDVLHGSVVRLDNGEI